MRDVIIIGATRADAHRHARTLPDTDRPRIVTARSRTIDGAVADEWIILPGVPAHLVDLARYTAAKNGAPVRLLC